MTSFIIRALVKTEADDPRDHDDIHAELCRALHDLGIQAGPLIVARAGPEWEPDGGAGSDR